MEKRRQEDFALDVVIAFWQIIKIGLPAGNAVGQNFQKTDIFQAMIIFS